MAASSDCRRCCPTSSQSLVLGKTPLPAQPSVSLSVNPCWQMQGMFQPRALDGAFLFPCLFSLTETAAPALPARPQGPGLSQGMLRWLSELTSTSVGVCISSPVSGEALLLPNLPDNQPTLLSLALLSAPAPSAAEENKLSSSVHSHGAVSPDSSGQHGH